MDRSDYQVISQCNIYFEAFNTECIHDEVRPLGTFESC